MNEEEITEILDKLLNRKQETLLQGLRECQLKNIEHVFITRKEYIDKVLNYLNDLQQANQELKKQLEELEKENLNLREYIMTNKTAIPYEEIKDKSLYDLYTMPSYIDLVEEDRKYKEVINKIKKVCNSIPITHSICGIEKIHDIENILKKVE